MALARRFAAGVFRPALLSRRPPETAAADLEDAVLVAADVADPDALTRGIEAAVGQVGPVRALLFNPSVTLMGRPSQVDPAAAADALAVGAVGAITAAQAVLPHMRAQGRGTLLFTGGGTALKPWVDAVAIGLQKAALRNYALALAAELRSEPLRAGTITINGVIGSAGFEPDLIAQTFWEWHLDPAAPDEVVFDG
jgi:NAD(P)-dependent dehydrogenase (short-subunit alcohol dehydrogenase family)